MLIGFLSESVIGFAGTRTSGLRYLRVVSISLCPMSFCTVTIRALLEQSCSIRVAELVQGRFGDTGACRDRFQPPEQVRQSRAFPAWEDPVCPPWEGRQDLDQIGRQGDWPLLVILGGKADLPRAADAKRSNAQVQIAPSQEIEFPLAKSG
jgi:hypothetical protein